MGTASRLIDQVVGGNSPQDVVEARVVGGVTIRTASERAKMAKSRAAGRRSDPEAFRARRIAAKRGASKRLAGLRKYAKSAEGKKKARIVAKMRSEVDDQLAGKGYEEMAADPRYVIYANEAEGKEVLLSLDPDDGDILAVGVYQEDGLDPEAAGASLDEIEQEL